MTVAHRVEMALAEDGKLSIDRLPFRAGQVVEVIVSAVPATVGPDPLLAGTVMRYDRPNQSRMTIGMRRDDYSRHAHLGVLGES